MSDKCPKCRHKRNPSDTECPRCGIVYSKFEEVQQQRRKELREKHFSGKQQTSKRYSKVIAAIVVIFVIFSAVSLLKSSNKKKTAEAIAKQKQEAIKEEEARIRQAQRKADYEKCKADLNCWGDRHDTDAIYKAEILIEKHAKYDFEWTDGFMEKKLSKVQWYNKSELTVSYFGDKIKFQNGFGAWQNMVYQVDYDPINDKVIGVRVSPGRL